MRITGRIREATDALIAWTVTACGLVACAVAFVVFLAVCSMAMGGVILGSWLVFDYVGSAIW